MATPARKNQEQDVLPITRTAVLDRLSQMIAALPDALDDDGTGILVGILGASTWEGVNTEGTMPNAEKMAGIRQKIVSLGKKPSDIEGGLPFYVVVEAVHADTGEMLKWQTSSDTIVAQLMRLAMLGNIPALVTVEKAPKPTKAGFYPMSLRVHAAEQSRH